MNSSINWNGKRQTHDGDKTTTGATCQGNYQGFIEEGKILLRVGDKTTVCPACKQIGVIDSGDETVILDGKPAAIDGSIIRCGCPYGSHRVIAS